MKSIPKTIVILARRISKLQKEARKLGVFPNDRPLLACPKCQLEEDVAVTGLLFVTKRGARNTDTGLRFKINYRAKRARCPACGANIRWDDDGPIEAASKTA